jgi:Biopolymer transport protein
VIVSVDEQGQFFINEEKTASSLSVVRAKARAFYQERPELPFYVKGDAEVAYDSVMQAMVALQQAGIPTVGLVTRRLSADELPPLETEEELEDIKSIEMKTDL